MAFGIGSCSIFGIHTRLSDAALLRALVAGLVTMDPSKSGPDISSNARFRGFSAGAELALGWRASGLSTEATVELRSLSG